MGYIDNLCVTLTCPKCGAVEEAAALDKGSAWNGSHWHRFDEFKLFNTTCDGGGKQEPTIVAATCKKCGSTVNPNYAYRP